MKLRYKILFLIVILLTIYTVYTFPRSINQLTLDNVQSISIFYEKDVFDKEEKKEIIIDDSSEVSQLMRILNKSRYRKKILFKTQGFIKSTNEIGFMFLIISNGKEGINPLQFYSDGTICDGSNEYHIGLFGKSEAKEIYNELLIAIMD